MPNKLWEARRFRLDSTDRTIYNASTLGTVGAGVMCMYAVLFLRRVPRMPVSDREDILRATYGHREMERRLTREQTETQE
ncbi:MAG: hypothetical protein L0H59_00220 [Tomitella sp.]|nr:hypothetical protein [Tomitella sp.]